MTKDTTNYNQDVISNVISRMIVPGTYLNYNPKSDVDFISAC